MRWVMALVLAVLGCNEAPEETDDPTCFSPTRPQADMSPGKGCSCEPDPDQVVGNVRYQCRLVWGSLTEQRQWFAVSENQPSGR